MRSPTNPINTVRSNFVSDLLVSSLYDSPEGSFKGGILKGDNIEFETIIDFGDVSLPLLLPGEAGVTSLGNRCKNGSFADAAEIISPSTLTTSRFEGEVDDVTSTSEDVLFSVLLDDISNGFFSSISSCTC